jgi:rsbT co-antagonist protein RsbR
MADQSQSRLGEIVRAHHQEILDEWIALQINNLALRSGLMRENELRDQSRDFLDAFEKALESGVGARDLIDSAKWSAIRETLFTISRSRARLGFSPVETATFVFSLKQPIFDHIRRDIGNDATALGEATWEATEILDRLGLFTSEAYLKSREEIISRQQQELLELSTPVVALAKGILALPLIGTLDSQRTQVVMESLLKEIVETGSDIAIIDITGVPLVDTLVAQHLLKTIAAARLMGADCIISGIRPQIAQTIVHLGVELGSVVTKATLADAFAIALQRTGKKIVSIQSPSAARES